jgi:hypothetical protein
MDIFRRIRILMVVSMMGNPPKDTLLSTGTAYECENELIEAADFKGMMGKVSMISPRDGKGPNKINGQADPQRGPCEWDKKGHQGTDVREKEKSVSPA